MFKSYQMPGFMGDRFCNGGIGIGFISKDEGFVIFNFVPSIDSFGKTEKVAVLSKCRTGTTDIDG